MQVVEALADLAKIVIGLPVAQALTWRRLQQLFERGHAVVHKNVQLGRLSVRQSVDKVCMQI